MNRNVTTTARWPLPFGAEVDPGGGVRFAVWTPRARQVDVAISTASGRERIRPLGLEADGVFAANIADAGAGDRYRFRLDSGESFPDPWSRSQPDGVHGASEVVDPETFRWTDHAWPGPDPSQLVIYELHVGTFTAEGTFDAVIGQLDALRRLGVTAIELMPVAEFPGQRNWGYDGVDLFAPTRTYGGVLGLKRLVDAAHRRGLSVLLDVVYNHLGPDGNYLAVYSNDYFTNRHQTPWGQAINFDGPSSRRVREFFIQNACYWLAEYRVDGLRLDATHAIVDTSPIHVLAELQQAARTAVAPRWVHLAAEDGRNDVNFVRPVAKGGCGLDAVWSDDFHHTIHTLLTGEREGYYADYDGSAGAIARTIASGFFYQGQFSARRKAPRGTPVGNEPGSAFVFCIQNHDQIGNRGFGERLHQIVDPRQVTVATVLLLLSPETPLLFMGQEFAASAPFLFFTDHNPELGRLVTAGRRQEFAHFAAFADPTTREQIPDPQADKTFLRSRLDFAERSDHLGIYRLHRDLLRLRRLDPVFANADRPRTATSAPSDRCVVVRRWDRECGPERLVVANFGPALSVRVTSDPNLHVFSTGRWRQLLSTGAPKYGGEGRRSTRRGTGDATVLFVPEATAVVWSADSLTG